MSRWILKNSIIYDSKDRSNWFSVIAQTLRVQRLVLEAMNYASSLKTKRLYQCLYWPRKKVR